MTIKEYQIEIEEHPKQCPKCGSAEVVPIFAAWVRIQRGTRLGNFFKQVHIKCLCGHHFKLIDYGEVNV